MPDAENPTPPEPSKAEVIAQIAKTLSERRKARSLSLERVHQTLKIRLNHLQAMENGNWEELPGEVFVRGFLRRYANYLGLDADKLLAPYLEKVNQPLKKSAELTPLFKKVDPLKGGWIWIAAAVLVAIAVFKMIRVTPSPAPKAAAPAAPVRRAVVSTETAKAEERPSAELKHKLEVFSPFPLWVRVQSQDRAFEGFIPEGATWTWRGAGQFTVKLGHTKEVALFFDGLPVALSENDKKIELPAAPAVSSEN